MNSYFSNMVKRDLFDRHEGTKAQSGEGALGRANYELGIEWSF